jgi:hypothetical protein
MTDRPAKTSTTAVAELVGAGQPPTNTGTAGPEFGGPELGGPELAGPPTTSTAMTTS